MADLFERDSRILANIESLDNGKCFSKAIFDVFGCVAALRYCAGWCDKHHGKTVPVDGKQFAYTRKEPVGVVGQISKLIEFHCTYIFIINALLYVFYLFSFFYFFKFHGKSLLLISNKTRFRLDNIIVRTNFHICVNDIDNNNSILAILIKELSFVDVGLEDFTRDRDRLYCSYEAS